MTIEPRGRNSNTPGAPVTISRAPAVTQGIDHVAIVVADPADAVSWFQERFGLDLVNDEVVLGEVNVRLLYLAAADNPEATTIQVVSPVGDGAVARHLSTRGEGLHHICFSVEDVPDTLHALGELDTPTFVGGYGITCAFLRQDTPGGLNIELAGNRSPRSTVGGQGSTSAEENDSRAELPR